MSIAQQLLAESRADLMLRAMESSGLCGQPQPAIRTANIEKLRRYFACQHIGQKTEEVYSGRCIDFFLRYGLANVLKNYYTLSELNELGLLSKVTRILDVGSGPGVFALAYRMWKSGHRTQGARPVDLLMIDPTNEFFELFDSLWARAPLGDKANLAITRICSLTYGDLPYGDIPPDLIVFSNSLSEMLRDSRVDLCRLVHSIVQTKAVVFVIDQLYETTAPVFHQFADAIAPYYSTLAVYGWPHWDKCFDQVDLGRIEYSFQNAHEKAQQIRAGVKFLKAILVPSDMVAGLRLRPSMRIVQLYKRAWEEHDTALLRRLFTPDATYREKSRARPFQGIEEICDYWKENSQRQRNVVFLPRFVVSDHDCIRAMWKSSFFRVDLGRWLLLSGQFEAKIRRGRIADFRERFQKRSSLRRPLVPGDR
ncbi:MAG: nuclear transport factor 2 family protein [Planctomycetota bacterium]|jgi:hypothetical protein